MKDRLVFKNNELKDLSSLDTIIINEYLLNIKYYQIGFGDESVVYKYDDNTVIKIFKEYDSQYLINKIKKIELLSKINDESYQLPLRLVLNEEGNILGYAMESVLLNNRMQPTNFKKVYIELNQREIINCSLKVDAASRRMHNRGVMHGDIQGKNILIGLNNEPKFVDTDGYAIGPYGFDLNLWALNNYIDIFGKDCELIDNEKFLFGMAVMENFLPRTFLYYEASVEYFKNLIEILEVNNQAKEILSAIFSDSPNKPYIGDALVEFDLEKPIVDKQKLLKINRIGTPY